VSAKYDYYFRTLAGRLCAPAKSNLRTSSSRRSAGFAAALPLPQTTTAAAAVVGGAQSEAIT